MLQHKGANLTPKQIQLLKETNFESIRRTRQKLQEQGKYPASVRVKKERDLKAVQMRYTVGGVDVAELIEQRPSQERFDAIDNPVGRTVSWL
jgi:hypothetical protein